MKKINVNDSLKKLNTAKSILKILDKLRPEMLNIMSELPTALSEVEKIFFNIKDVFPKINKLHEKIENSLEKMPKAKSKIENVSKETEETTLGIMDKVDTLIDSNIKISSICEELEKETNLAENVKNKINEMKNIASSSEQILNEIYTQLQFQDITSQQLYAARGILIEVNNSFAELLDKFKIEIDDRKGTYDIDASMDQTLKNQENINQILNE